MMGLGRRERGGIRPAGPGRDGPGRDIADRDVAGRDGAGRSAGLKVAGSEQAARGVTMIVATACLGTAMMVLPALSLPRPGQALTVAGLLLVAASLVRPLARWHGTATLAAVAA